MKKFLLFFILSLSFTSVKSVNAQLEYYYIIFNIYDEGLRVSDSTKFKVSFLSTDRETDEVKTFLQVKPILDISNDLSHDYVIFKSAEMLRQYTVNIFIIRNNTDTMNIKIDNKKSSAWALLAMDKVDFSPGFFLITEKDWPDVKKYSVTYRKHFPFLDENFDWDKIRE